MNQSSIFNHIRDALIEMREKFWKSTHLFYYNIPSVILLYIIVSISFQIVWCLSLRLISVSLSILHLSSSFDGFESNSTSVRNSQFFSRLRCQPNNRAMCALDKPTKSYSLVTKEQCCSYCNSVDWKWFNFIGDEGATKCSVGDCQLFDYKLQNISEKSQCSLWKVCYIANESHSHTHWLLQLSILLHFLPGDSIQLGHIHSPFNFSVYSSLYFQQNS